MYGVGWLTRLSDEYYDGIKNSSLSVLSSTVSELSIPL